MSWQVVGNIRGPQGSVGPAGPKGDPGDAGDFDEQDVINALGFTPADVAALATIATSGSASDLIAGTVPDARMRDGLRATLINISTSTVDSTGTPTGWYSISAASTTVDEPGVLMHYRASNTGSTLPRTTQLLYTASGTVYRRTATGIDTWTEWERFAYLNTSYWVTEDGDNIVTEDGDKLIFVTGIK